MDLGGFGYGVCLFFMLVIVLAEYCGFDERRWELTSEEPDALIPARLAVVMNAPSVASTAISLSSASLS